MLINARAVLISPAIIRSLDAISAIAAPEVERKGHVSFSVYKSNLTIGMKGVSITLYSEAKGAAEVSMSDSYVLSVDAPQFISYCQTTSESMVEVGNTRFNPRLKMKRVVEARRQV